MKLRCRLGFHIWYYEWDDHSHPTREAVCVYCPAELPIPFRERCQIEECPRRATVYVDHTRRCFTHKDVVESPMSKAIRLLGV